MKVLLVVMLLNNGPRQQVVDGYKSMWDCMDAAKRWSDSLPDQKYKMFKCEEKKL